MEMLEYCPPLNLTQSVSRGVNYEGNCNCNQLGLSTQNHRQQALKTSSQHIDRGWKDHTQANMHTYMPSPSGQINDDGTDDGMYCITKDFQM